MSRRFDASEQLTRVIDLNEAVIKDEYFTIRLFVDSAIRAKLRGLGIKDVGQDEVIEHIEKLQAAKQSRYEKTELYRKRKRAIDRIHVSTNKLNKKLGE